MENTGKKRMVNERLIYYLETKGMLHSDQSGFKRRGGTMDPTVCLEDVIRKAQINNETVLVV